ncbi:MAG TPA: hypothetical protein VM890_03990 [Longimicrobium sp.]|nr:hypothetical protein [Longimicrobium sp.]
MAATILRTGATTEREVEMPWAQPERKPQHDTASSALLLWSIATVLLVAPSIGFALVGLRGVTLLAAATVAAGIGFGVLYLKYSEVVLTWLEARTRLQDRLGELEARAKSLETTIDRSESPDARVSGRTDPLP